MSEAEKTHPSVVRDRNPDLRLILQMAQEKGAKYAEFIPNPTCCAICAKRRGEVRRISTLLKRTYLTVHPNCFCQWHPLPVTQPWVSRKGAAVEDVDGFDGDAFEKGRDRSHLVKKTITDKLGRKRSVWVRPDAAKPTPEKPGQRFTLSESVGADLEAFVAKIPAKTRKALNDATDALRKTPPGKTSKHNGVPIKNIGGGKFNVHGLVFDGLRQASLAVHAAELITASGGQLATGGMAGADMASAHSAEKLVGKVEHTSSKVQGAVKNIEHGVVGKLPSVAKKRTRTRKPDGTSSSGGVEKAQPIIRHVFRKGRSVSDSEGAISDDKTASEQESSSGS